MMHMVEVKGHCITDYKVLLVAVCPCLAENLGLSRDAVSI